MLRRPATVSAVLSKSCKGLQRDTKISRTVRSERYVEPCSDSEDLNEGGTDSDLEDNGISSSGRESQGSQGDSEDTEDEYADADAPRVARWADEDEFNASSDFGRHEESDDEDDTRPAHVEKIQNDLSSLPLGTLRKAQHALYQTEVDSDSESYEDSDHSNDSGGSKRGDKAERSTRLKRDIPKRRNKHAPTEISSKKPVTRRRQVVEVKGYQPRDPRFLSLAGEFSAEKFHNNYSFLLEARQNELKTLKEDLKRARRMLSSAPRDRRTERENEVKRLELAVQRTESLVNKDRQDKIRLGALQKAAKEEQEKRKQGKRGWWMKKAEEKKLVVEAKYKALAEEGGNRAVKKAIARKQKKIGQREKRRRPAVREREAEAGRKRRRIE